MNDQEAKRMLEAINLFKELDFSQYDVESIQPLLEPFREYECESSDIMIDPLMIFAGYSAIHEQKIKYEKGDKLALAYAIQIAAQHNLIMPKWLSGAVVKRIRDVTSYEVRDWSDIFGSVLKKGQRIEKLRKIRKLPWRIKKDFDDAKKAGQSTNDEFAYHLAEKYSINRSEVWELKKIDDNWYKKITPNKK